MTPPKRVLIVEDDIRIHDFYRSVLGRFETTFVTSAEEAIALVESGKRYDLLITDIDLLGVSGSTLVETAAREEEKYPPVIVCSSHSDSENRKRLVEAGAWGFLAKPVAIDELLYLTNKLLGS